MMKPCIRPVRRAGIARLDRRVVQSACLIAGVLIIAFWATWFIDRDLLASEHRSEYVTFENAFPLADAWLAFCCLAAFRALLTRRPSALLWLVAAGSASAFLTGMDVLYDLTNGIYTRGGPAVLELVINVLTATLAVVTLTWGWTRRVELLA